MINKTYLLIPLIFVHISHHHPLSTYMLNSFYSQFIYIICLNIYGRQIMLPNHIHNTYQHIESSLTHISYHSIYLTYIINWFYFQCILINSHHSIYMINSFTHYSYLFPTSTYMLGRFYGWFMTIASKSQ